MRQCLLVISCVLLIRCASTAPPASKWPKSYTVQRGDSLFSMAQHFYGDGKKWPTIFNANRDKFPNIDMMTTGMVLTIPAPRR